MRIDVQQVHKGPPQKPKWQIKSEEFDFTLKTFEDRVVLLSDMLLQAIASGNEEEAWEYYKVAVDRVAGIRDALARWETVQDVLLGDLEL